MLINRVLIKKKSVFYFHQAVQLYSDKQYTGQDLIWAFKTLDPKWDYELEPVTNTEPRKRA